MIITTIGIEFTDFKIITCELLLFMSTHDLETTLEGTPLLAFNIVMPIVDQYSAFSSDLLRGNQVNNYGSSRQKRLFKSTKVARLNLRSQSRRKLARAL